MGLVYSTISNILYFSEKLVVCLAALGIVTCLVITIIMVLSIGVGLGYNYCFVEFKSKREYVSYYKYNVLRDSTPIYAEEQYDTPPYQTLFNTEQNNHGWTTSDPEDSDEDLKALEKMGKPETNGTDLENMNITLTFSSLDLTNTTKNNITNVTNDDIADNFYEYDITNSTLVGDIKDADNKTKLNASRKQTELQISGLDLFALLLKLRSENKNYTLKIETD